MPHLDGRITIDAPIGRCFDLVRSIDFHEAAARSIDGAAIGGKTSGLATKGDSTQWRATFFGLKFRLTTQIDQFAPPGMFREVMTRGLFKSFSHTYRLSIDGQHTVLEDQFEFASPLGVLGQVIDRYVLLKPMRRAQTERLEAIKSALESGSAEDYLKRN